MNILHILPLLFVLSFGCNDNSSYASGETHDDDVENHQESGSQESDTDEHSNDSHEDALTVKIDLNTGSKEDFSIIPGMNNKMQYEFDEYRPYASIGQFRREMGKYVDTEIIEGYEKYVYVPIDRNESDAETIMQIPGISSEIAAAIVAARPFETNADFLGKVAEMASDFQSDSVAYMLSN